MQIHGPSAVVHGIKVEKYARDGDMALVFPAGIKIVLQSPGDCDELIRAAAAAKAEILAAQTGGES